MFGIPPYTEDEIAAAQATAKVWVGDLAPSDPEYLKRAVIGALNGLRFKREDARSGGQSFVIGTKGTVKV